jgi:3-hydroxyisobutyrate dehydrogenase-like beta-hydroxyacid dehydrogenase
MSRKSRKNVGVIGLGIIGSRVAAALRTAGYQVYVWNRSAKPAPNFLGSPAEIAESADIIQLFVADATALFEVIEAMGDALSARHIIICSGTVGPEAVLEAAQVVESKGAQFLDAPFTGSKLAAEKRQLIYYIGGAEHTFLKAKPILEATSKGLVRIGEVGHASSVKVVTNMISAVTTQVLAEALSIVQKAGLEPEVLAAAIEHNACRSGVIDLKLPKMIAGDYEAHFSLKNMFKDVQLGIHMANALDIEIPATTVTAGVIYGALNQGWGDLDYASVFKNYATPEPVDEYPALPHIPHVAIPSQIPMTAEEVLAEAEGGPGSAGEPAEPEKQAEETPPDESRGEPGNSTGIFTMGSPPSDAEPGSPSSQGTPVQETVPTAVAAQMIEVMLSHSEGHGAPKEATPESAIKEAAPVVEGVKAQEPSASHGESKAPEGAQGASETGKDEKPTNGENKTTAESTPEEAKAESDNGEKPAETGGEAAAPTKNFVRRWFVARSGGG